MIKKIFGGLLCIFAVLVVVGSIANGNLFGNNGSVAETIGTSLGTLIPVVLYILSGIFLITFEKTRKLNYIEGFRKRGKQIRTIVFFVIIYAILMISTFFTSSNRISMLYMYGYIDNVNVYLLTLVYVLPYLIPLVIFSIMLEVYAFSYWSSKKYFLNSETALQEYLSDSTVFYTHTQDDSVLTSNGTIFLPRFFCIIPFAQISSIKCVNELCLHYVFFYLTNGKKFWVLLKKQNCEVIQSFMSEQAQ